LSGFRTNYSWAVDDSEDRLGGFRPIGWYANGEMHYFADVSQCVLCGEEITDIDTRSPNGMPAHQECSLRAVMGGIGHLLDHAHYCVEMRDPDAGMTYRESARMVLTWVQVQGLD
jgi:hypothetical protein